MSNPMILYDNRFRDATPQVTHTANGYNVASLADYRAYTAWKGNNTANASISVGCGALASANAMGLVGHNLKTANTSLIVYSSNDGNNWTQRHNYTPTSDNAFLTTLSNASGNWWAVNTANSTAAAQIGELFLGTALAFPQPPDRPFAPYVAKVEADSATGKTGHILGSTLRYTGLEITAKFSNIDRTWAANNFTPFWNIHARYLRPFFWAWDLNNFPAHVFFVTLKPGAQYQTPISVHSMVDSITLEMTGVMEG